MQCAKCGQELPESSAFCPCCGEKAAGRDQEADKPVYQTDVKGIFKSSRLSVYRDRVEFSTSSAQKTVFNYAALVAVKKRLFPTPAILFITEDAQTESCPATPKNIHEAFLYVEQTVKPYLEARKARLLAQGVKYSFVSSTGITSSGVLNISDDRAEFQAKSGKMETVSFQDVKSVSLSGGDLNFSLFNGGTRAFSLDKELQEEVLAFVKKAIEPYLTQRREALLAKGIYFSFLSGLGQESGTLDIYEDRAEFTARSGRTVSVAFKDVRTAALYAEMLEFHLVDGTTNSFVVDMDEQDEILAFVRKAIEPYVRQRTEGFEIAFGSAERIEINEERGVFHIIRQNGAVITDECSLKHIVKCQWTESTELNLVIGGIRQGGKAIANKAAEMAGKQGAAEDEEKVRSIDVLLTIQTGEEQKLRFGDFPLGVSRTSPKYAQCAAWAAGLMDFLRENCPECQLIIPTPPAPEAAAEKTSAAVSNMEGPETAGKVTEPASPRETDPAQKYINAMSEYIGGCKTPTAIAFQGNAGSGEHSMMKRLSESLEDQYGKNLIWFHAKHLFRSNVGEKLPMLIGADLVSQLGGTNDGRMVRFAKVLINFAMALITQGNLDGQALIDVLFKNTPINSLDDLVNTFSELVKKKTAGGKDKVVVLLDGLDDLAPAKVVEGLEAMEDFFSCKGCVFVVAVEYATVLQGVNERYSQEDGNRGKNFFTKTFRFSFRVPASEFQVGDYVKNRLEDMDLAADDEAEVELYCELLAHSIGNDSNDVAQLFDSLEMPKRMLGEDLCRNKGCRLILLGLLCMQTRFCAVYDQLVQIKESVTPELLLGLCDAESDVVARSGLAEEEKADFLGFAQIFCNIINTDGMGGLSQAECGTFVQVLESSSITSR